MRYGLLTDQEALCIDHIGFGSATFGMLSKQLGSKQFHQSRSDYVPLLGDPIGYLMALLGLLKNVHWRGSWFRIPFSTHGFRGKDYQEALHQCLSPAQ